MRRILLVFILLITILFISSCTNQVPDNTSLAIYTMEGDVNVQKATDEFNKTHKSTSIITEKFFSDQKQELSNMLQSELAIGEGPDIVIFEPEMLPELSKLMEKGAFYDINELIKSDKRFNMKLYNDKIMDYGLYKGKRYVVPLCYSIKAFFSTDDSLNKSDIKYDATFINMNDITVNALDYIKHNKSGSFFSPLDFSYFIDLSSGFINIEERKSNFNTVEFQKLLDSYKKLYEASYKGKSFKDYIKDGTDAHLLKNGDTLMNLQEINCFKLLWGKYSTFTEEISPVIRMISADKGELHTSATPVKLVAVNTNCKSKKNAFEFIKLLLSDKYQENAQVFNLPVNIKAYESQKEIFLRGIGREDYIIPMRGGGVKSDSTAKKMVSDVLKITEKLDRCSLSDYKIYSLIDETVKKFLNGTISNIEVAQEAQNNIQKYFDAPITVSTKKKSDKEEPIKRKLGFYCYASPVAKNMLRIFQNKYLNVEVEVTDGNSDEINNKIATDIMSGDGPDVVLFYPRFFLSLNKAIDSGAFICLDDLIEKDKEFKHENYFERVLGAGVYHGKRYCIPLDYKINFLFTTPEVLKSNNIQYDKNNWTWNEFSNLAKTYINSVKGKDQYFLGNTFSFITMLSNCGMQFIDYNSKCTRFNSREFIGLIKAFGELNGGIMPDEAGTQAYNTMKLFKSYIFALNTDLYTVNWKGIVGTENIVKQYNNDELMVIPMPSLNKGDNPLTNPSSYVAIGSNCRYKEDAYNIIKILLSKDMQKFLDGYGNYNSPFMPVNKEAYEWNKEFFSNEKSKRYYYLEPQENYSPMTQSIALQFDSIVKNAELNPQYDFNILMIINEEVDNYILGKKSAEDAAEEIDRKVTLILDE